MNKHLHQAKHNADFLKLIQTHSPNGYFDWKITVTFYTALHLVQAHAESLKFATGTTHISLNEKIFPKSGTPISLPELVYYAYEDLKSLSRNARYIGISVLDKSLYNIVMSSQFSDASDRLKIISDYYSTKNIKL